MWGGFLEEVVRLAGLCGRIVDVVVRLCGACGETVWRVWVD